MTQEYYAQVAAAFDRAAASYRADYAANPIMAWLTDDTFRRLCRLFPAGSRLLEIGCGTGEMALRLAEAGRIIVATDIAPAMIAQAQRNAAASPAVSRLTWLTVPAGELGQAVAGLPVGENAPLTPQPWGEPDSPRSRGAGGAFFEPCFDGAYSNFGPLNCEPDLGRVARDLAEMLPPGAAFLCSVMNRWCAWEIGWGLLRLRPREATRRLGRGWVAAAMSAGPGEAPSTLPVRYFTPREFARAFQLSFRLETCLGYPTLLPPPYLAGRFARAISRLGALERRVAGWPGFRSLGDHFLLVLRRTGEAG